MRKLLLRGIFTSAFCITIGCSIDRIPDLLDSAVPSESDGSAEQESSDDAPTQNWEERRDSGVVPNFEEASRDSGTLPDASARDVSTRDASSQDTLADDASMSDTSIIDTSIGDEPETDSAPPDDAEQPEPCDLRGIYGGQVTVEAWWGGRSIGELVAIVDAGRATILINTMLVIDSIESDGTISATVKTCNIELPPFYSSIVCESYYPIFPVQAWDSDKNPWFTVSGQAECTRPGCMVHVDTLAAQLGVELDDPFDDWPQASETLNLSCDEGKGSDCFPDHDDDGYPGITADLLTRGIARSTTNCEMSMNGRYYYRAAPISFNLAIFWEGAVPRTDRIHLGTRAMIGSDIKIKDDCSGAKGMAVAEGFDSRAISCFLQEGTPTGDDNGTLADENTLCTKANRQFMDENLPIYNCMKKDEVPPEELTAITNREPSEGPRMSLVKLGEIGDNVTCGDVRNASY